MKLIIGNQNYSSWSLRPWLLLRHFNLAFEPQTFWLSSENRRQKLGVYSPSCKVPVLQDESITVWDTLAICEYINEKYLAGKGWPADLAVRAKARAVVCEMHSGFSALRNEMPMNCRAKRSINVSDDALRDIKRLDAILAQAEGPWLFGAFSIADCFFAPVAFRFNTYGIQVSAAAGRYCERLLNHPDMQLWQQQALLEKERLPEAEMGAQAAAG